jgi:hypothetical protein
VTFWRREEIEIGEMGVAADLHFQRRVCPPRQVVGHQERVTSIERKDVAEHPAVAQTDEVGPTRRALPDQSFDGVVVGVACGERRQ